MRIDRDIDVFLLDLTSTSCWNPVPSSLQQVEDSVQDTAFKEDEGFYVFNLIIVEPKDLEDKTQHRRNMMSSILKRPASPIPSASGPNHTAKKVKLEEAIQNTEELYDPDLDDGLAREGQVLASTESASNLKEAQAEAEAEVQKELMALMNKPTGLQKLIALAVSPYNLAFAAMSYAPDLRS